MSAQYLGSHQIKRISMLSPDTHIQKGFNKEQFDELCAWIDEHIQEQIGWSELMHESGFDHLSIQSSFAKYKALYFAKDDWIDRWSKPDSCINSDHPICSWICSSIQAHSSSNCSLLNPFWIWVSGESIEILLIWWEPRYWALITICSLIGFLFHVSTNPQLGKLRKYPLGKNPEASV